MNWPDIDIELIKENFHFLRPKLLYALVPVLVVFLLTWFSRRKKEKWIKLIPVHLRPYMITGSSNRSQYFARILLLFIMGLMVFMMAGPTWKQQDIPGKKNESVVLILLDASQSMLAADVQPNRLERAKFKIKDFLSTNPRCRVGLMVYSGTAHMVVPFTDQYQSHLLQLQNLVPSVMPLTGTDLPYAFKLVKEEMRPFKAPGTVWLITDDLEQKDLNTLADFVKDTPHSISLTTLATPEGAKVPGANVVSKLNTALIKELAGNARIRPTVFTLDNSDVEKLVEQIRKNQVLQDKMNSKQSIWIDEGPLFFWILLPFGALWFRRGWRAVSLLPVLFGLSSCGKVSSDDLWYTRNYQGQQLMKTGNYAKAAEKFKDPERKGIAYLKAGNTQLAIKNFLKDSSATGFYNAGIAYAKTGDYETARQYFDQALRMDPTLSEAKENRDQLSVYLDKKRALEEAEAARNSKFHHKKEGERATKKKAEPEGGDETEGASKQKAPPGTQPQSSVEEKGGEAKESKNMGDKPPPSNFSNVLIRRVPLNQTEFQKRKFNLQYKRYYRNAPKPENTW